MKVREKVAVLIEIKRHPSRKAMDNHEVVGAKRRNLAAKAKWDVVIQVCMLLSSDSIHLSLNLTKNLL